MLWLGRNRLYPTGCSITMKNDSWPKQFIVALTRTCPESVAGLVLLCNWGKHLQLCAWNQYLHDLIDSRGSNFCCPRNTELYMYFQWYYFTWGSLPKVMIKSIGLCMSWIFHHNASLYDSELSWRWIFPCTLSGLEGMHTSSFITSKWIDIDSKAWWTWRWSWTYSWLK